MHGQSDSVKREATGSVWHSMQRETKSERPSRSVARSTCWILPARANSGVTPGGGAKLIIWQLLRLAMQTIAAKIDKCFNFINRCRKSCVPGDPVHLLCWSLVREW